MGRKPKKTTGIGKRIAYARDQAGLTQTALGKQLGLTRSAVSQWESEDTEPSAENLRAIAVATNVNYDWLATGRGSPQGDHPSHPQKGIVEIDVRAGLGGGGTTEGREVMRDGKFSDPLKDEGWKFPARFMREEIRAPESRVVILETSGDSMSPTILSGDRVIVDTGHRLPSPDGIYALRDQYGNIVVKRLQLLRGADPPRLKIISDNKSHEAEEVSADEITIVGRVLWALTRL
jgi:phage repressor protein C with HTH and peptisase S24 domain